MSSLLSSLKIKRRPTDSIKESLLGTKGSRTISTNTTTMTFQNCLKSLQNIIILIEFIGYIITWIYYIISKSIDDATNIYFFANSPFKMSRFEAYYWMQIIVQSTMIIICMMFYIEFILYIDVNWIKAVKDAKEKHKKNKMEYRFSNKMESVDNNYNDSVTVKLPKRHKSKTKLQISIIDDCNICGKLCSFEFCCQRIGAAIANTFTLTWSGLHILCMISCTYYLLSVMLRLYHSFDKNKALLAVSDGLTAFGIILPPIAYSLCSRLKSIYERNSEYCSDSTVAGSKWEQNVKKQWYSSQYTQMSIVQASKSILNDNFLKMWICTIFSLQFLAFITEPIVGPDKFRYYLDSIYQVPTTSSDVFMMHILITRIAVPLLLMDTILSFLPNSSHRAQIVDYNHFHHILTPPTIILIIVIAFLSNYSLFGMYQAVTISYILTLVFFACWQFWIFIQLLQLAEDAENDQEQFFAFTRNTSLFNYFSKGLLMMILWAMSFGSLIIYEGDNNATNIDKERTYREIPSIIFAVTSMFMLVPLQKVAISPTYKSYFRRKNKKIYMATFHIICLLCMVFISQKIIFIATFYHDLFNNQTHLKNATYAASFSLSFSSIGFFLWLFGKYSGILFPILPKAARNTPNSRTTVTEISVIHEEVEKNINTRKHSNLSLTELYNRKHIPSIPDRSDNEEQLLPKRAKSMSFGRKQSSPKYLKKPNKKKLIKMGKTEDEIQPILTWSDAAKVYGIKSKALSSTNNDDNDEKYSLDSD